MQLIPALVLSLPIWWLAWSVWRVSVVLYRLAVPTLPEGTPTQQPSVPLSALSPMPFGGRQPQRPVRDEQAEERRRLEYLQLFGVPVRPTPPAGSAAPPDALPVQQIR